MLPNTTEQYGSICMGSTRSSNSAEKEIEKFWSRGFNGDLALLRKQWAEVFPAMKKSLVDPLRSRRAYASMTDFFEHWSSLTPDEVTAIDWPPVNWFAWQVEFRAKRGNR